MTKVSGTQVAFMMYGDLKIHSWDVVTGARGIIGEMPTGSCGLVATARRDLVAFTETEVSLFDPPKLSAGEQNRERVPRLLRSRLVHRPREREGGVDN